MTRKILTDAIAETVGECGIAFYTGFEYRMVSELKRFPAVWLVPPELEKTEGRNEGVKHYAVKMYLIAGCAGRSSDAKETQWAQLESAASRLCVSLGKKDCVLAVTEAGLAPAEFSLTAAADLSVELKFKVMVPFCNYCDAQSVEIGGNLNLK